MKNLFGRDFVAERENARAALSAARERVQAEARA